MLTNWNLRKALKKKKSHQSKVNQMTCLPSQINKIILMTSDLKLIIYEQRANPWEEAMLDREEKCLN